MKNLIGFRATMQDVFMQNMNQMRINWNLDSWKALSSSKCVDSPFPSPFRSYLMFIQVYKAIFTSPSSAKDISEDSEDNAENMPPAKSQRTCSGKKPVRRNVASKVNLNNKVTPRSIAYAAVQVGFVLLDVALCSFVAAASFQFANRRIMGPILWRIRLSRAL